MCSGVWCVCLQVDLGKIRFVRPYLFVLWRLLKFSQCCFPNASRGVMADEVREGTFSCQTDSQSEFVSLFPTTISFSTPVPGTSAVIFVSAKRADESFTVRTLSQKISGVGTFERVRPSVATSVLALGMPRKAPPVSSPAPEQVQSKKVSRSSKAKVSEASLPVQAEVAVCVDQPVSNGKSVTNHDVHSSSAPSSEVLLIGIFLPVGGTLVGTFGHPLPVLGLRRHRYRKLNLSGPEALVA